MMNRHLRVLTLVIVQSFFVFPGFSQDNPDEIIQQFFQNYEEDGSSIALDKLYSTNPWIHKAGDAILNLKNKMEELTEDFVGKYYGYELITEKTISDSYILKSFIVRFDRQPLRFTFQFYKPNDEWRIYSFKYDASLDVELEESAKLNNLSNDN